MARTNATEEARDALKSGIYGAFAAERTGDISKLECTRIVGDSVQKLVELGRLSVLRDFDAVCMADAFMGFSDVEWKGIQKFFAFNKEISGWDKEEK